MIFLQIIVIFSYVKAIFFAVNNFTKEKSIIAERPQLVVLLWKSDF